MNENIQQTTDKSKKFRPNIIDFIIIIAVVAAIIGTVIRTGIVEQAALNSNLEDARVSFLVENISETSGDCFNNGDSFYSDTHKCDFGTLEQFWTMPAEIYVTDERGQIIKTNSNNNRIDVRGTLICTGVFTEDGFFLDGTNYIAPNSTVTVKSAKLVVSLVITDIEKIAATE